MGGHGGGEKRVLYPESPEYGQECEPDQRAVVAIRGFARAWPQSTGARDTHKLEISRYNQVWACVSHQFIHPSVF